MAEDRQSFSIKEDKSGTVHVAGEVVAIIAGLAATEVEGVSSMAGNITNELVSKLGMKNLSKGVKVEVTDDSVEVNLSLNIAYGYSIPEVSNRVQESEGCDREYDRITGVRSKYPYRKCGYGK